MANIPTSTNNPGDLRFIGQTGGSQSPTGFAQFKDPKTGYAALLNDVQTKINNKPTATLADFSNIYAPSSDGNNSALYAAKLANQLGVRPDTQIKDLQPKIGSLAEAIAHNEGFQASTVSSSHTGYTPPSLTGEQTPQTAGQNNAYTPPTPPPASAPDSTQKPQGDPLPGQPYHGQNVIDWSNPPSWIPGSKIGQAIGTGIAKLMHPGQADWIDKNEPAPSYEQVGGDAIRSAALPVSLAAAPATILGMIAAGGAFGAANSGGNAMVNNADAGTIVTETGKGGLIGATTAGILGLTSKALGALGTKSVSLAVRPTAKDFADGYDSQFAVDNGLTGNAQQIADKARSYMSGLTEKLKSVLGNSDMGIDLAGVYDKTKADLTSQSGLESNFLQNSKIDKALATLQDEVLRTNPTGTLPLANAQTVKQMTGMYGEWANGVPDPDANAMATVANNFYHNLKVALEDAAPEGEVADINAQIQKAIPIMRAAIRRIPVDARASALSMTDMLSVLGFPLNPGAAVVAPAIQHAMNSGLMSKIAPPVAKGIGMLNTAISGQSPTVVSGLLPSK